MDYKDIIDNDYEKNHKGRSYSKEFVHDNFNKFIMNGGKIFKHEKSMFILRPWNDAVVEFHSINGGNSNDLLNGVNDLLKNLSNKFQFAVTYYDNPHVNNLIPKSNFPAKVSKIDQGEDKTFEAVFDLRG